jgi:hypothetical protein
MCFISSWLSIGWEFAKRHPAIALVLLGVLGEGIEVFSELWFEQWFEKHKRGLKGFGAFCWCVVMVGLACEVPDAFKTDKEAADARSFAATTESNNLVLRSNVAVLEAAVQWRTLNAKQKTALRQLLSDIHQANVNRRIGVKMFHFGSDIESELYADDLAAFLSECGFQAGINLQMGGEGVSGLGFEVSDKFPTGKSDTQAVYSAFKTAGVQCSIGEWPALVNSDDVTIFVGPKRTSQ